MGFWLKSILGALLIDEGFRYKLPLNRSVE